MFKVVIHMLQGPETVTQGDNVQTGPVVVPVTQEQASFATFFPGFGSGPLDKIQTVIVVCLTVGFESKMYVCEDRGFFK